MRNQKELGFTLVELLAVIVILAIILAIAIPGISGIISNSTKSSFKSDAKMILKAIEYKQLEDESFNPLLITKANMQATIGVNDANYEQVNFSLVDGKIRLVLVGTGKWEGLTAHGTFRQISVVNSDDYDGVPPVITILGDNPTLVIIGSTYTDAGATASDIKDGNLTSSIVTTGSVNASTLGTYTITYTVEDSGGNTTTTARTVNVVKEGNAPVLATGMTPIKWDGSAWVNTTADDNDWYSYTTTDKKWANARTADGSMWVWIPRYIYKISSGWHTSTAGTIDVLFSAGTDDTRGGSITLDAGATADASNNKWTNHPAFTFGTTELTGIWVSKFEAGGTTNAIDIKPNITSLRSLSVSDMFTATRNMETNSRYGWGTTGTDLDTHMMKNSEWGMTLYLAQSAYGKNAEIWTNPANDYTTGCAGDSAAADASAGCLRSYDTTNGMKASTTGNIYGVYDLAGGAYEYTAAYVDNGTANLTNGASLASANGKYKDIYPAEGAFQPYSTTNNKGHALYETSSNTDGYYSWYGRFAYMPYNIYPWFLRGGGYSSGGSTGVYNFNREAGTANVICGFRPIVLVGEGL